MSFQNWLGVAGFVLALMNTIQSWLRNRPVVSVRPGLHPRDAIDVEIENPSTRPVTILKSRCLPAEAHELFDPDRGVRAQIAAGAEGEINKIIRPGEKHIFSFLRTKNGGFILLISWQSNSAIIFSKIPLLVGMTQKRWERLLRAD